MGILVRVTLRVRLSSSPPTTHVAIYLAALVLTSRAQPTTTVLSFRRYQSTLAMLAAATM